MYTFCLIIFIIVCILLILIILLQSSRASGMELFGSGSQNVFGTQTGDILTKITTVLATLFFLGTIGLAMFQAKKTSIVEQKLKEMRKTMPPPTQPKKAQTTPGTNFNTNKKTNHSK